MMAERAYCSELNGAESMWGTADPVDVWLLLEYRPAWKAKALPESALRKATLDWIDRNVQALADAGLKARPQLVRQPELDRSDVRLLIGHEGRLMEYSGQGYGYLQNLDLVRELEGPSQARVLQRPRYFVCTNGQRDVCCSRYGLPVYRGLRELVGNRAWQVTHLGGHRFAANVLVLPDGVLYGRVQAESLEPFARAVEAGELSFPHLRGRSSYPKHVQAAEAAAGKSGLRLLHVLGDDAYAAVTFADRSSKLRVAVKRSDEPLEVLASCKDEAPKPQFPYRLVES